MADSADPDSDGLANLAEYASGTNPRQADRPAVTVRKMGQILLVEYASRTDRPEARLEWKESSDLVSWEFLTAAPVVVGHDENLERLQLEIPIGANHRFLSVSASRR